MVASGVAVGGEENGKRKMPRLKPVTGLVLAGTLGCMAHAGGALALACAGASPFSDIAPAEIFCTDAAWLANRGVTQGCAAGQFCPSANVTRAQMALFMQRLGTVLSPQMVRTPARDNKLSPIPTTVAPTSSNQIWCQASLEAATYPRVVQVGGWAALFTVDGNARIRVSTAYSRNEGSSWITYGSLYNNAQDMIEGDHHSFPISAQLVVAAGDTLDVGIYPRSLSGTSAAGLEGGDCDLHLLVFSQTGTSPPYDQPTGEMISGAPREVGSARTPREGR